MDGDSKPKWNVVWVSNLRGQLEIICTGLTYSEAVKEMAKLNKKRKGVYMIKKSIPIC